MLRASSPLADFNGIYPILPIAEEVKPKKQAGQG